MGEGLVPLWLKAAGVAFVAVLVPAYVPIYGIANFLWLSDICLFATVIALVTENRLIASMMAIGVMPLEIVWTVDLLTGGRLLKITGYMFDPKIPLWIRGLSLFHVAVPPILFWFLYRFGYDGRALPLQIGLSALILVLSYLLTPPKMNVNWVYGPGDAPQTRLPQLLYFAIILVVLPLGMCVPMHLVLSRFFG